MTEETTERNTTGQSGAPETMPIDVAPDIGTLKAYTRAKRVIAREIRSLRQFFKEQENEDGVSRCHELMVKLAEDRFTLAVLGQFKRGKSSLMNAIIGRNLLPTGMLPVTSAITVLAYGPEEKLNIVRDGVFFSEVVPAPRLADYVTEQGNPGNQKQVKTARLEMPLAFLRQGLEFVDTPGVGSTIEANTATTYEFLPQCDAVLFVTSADTPLTRTELDFLNRVREHVRKIFFVVNKMDLLNALESAQILAFISDTLKARMNTEQFRLFPVSSRLGLTAKMTGDLLGYARSGLKDLEEALAVSLSSEKSTTFLVAILDKALRLLAEVAEAPTRREPRSPTAPNSAEAERRSVLTAKLNILRQQLQHLQTQEFSDSHKDSLSSPPETLAVISPPPMNRGAIPEEPPETIQRADIASDLRTRGCPVCHRLEQIAFDFFAQWQYALSSEQDNQEAFAAELGFCHVHTWQLFSLSSPQGLSLGYPRLAERISGELSQLAQAPVNAPDGLETLVLGLRNCRACRLLRKAEEAYARDLANLLTDMEGRQAYAQSQGVCLPHLRQVLAYAANSEVAQFLLSEAARHFEAYAEDMQSYALKHDAIRRALLNRDEEGAYARAVVHIVGEEHGPVGF